MATNTQLKTKRPEKIFLCDQVIQDNSLLDAAIIGELFFWIAKGQDPWRKAGDYQELFHVNEKTIRRHFKFLSDDKCYLERKRTRLKNGGYGAYTFTSNNTKNSELLLSIYQGILNNSDIKHDFGLFNPHEPTYREIPRTQLLLTSSIEQTEDISTAYILDRICWAIISKAQDILLFSNKAHFARWSSLEYKTAIRTIEKLKSLGFADFNDKSGQLKVWVNDCASLHFFSNYMEGKHDERVSVVTKATA